MGLIPKITIMTKKQEQALRNKHKTLREPKPLHLITKDELAELLPHKENNLGVARLILDLNEEINNFQADSPKENLNIIHGLKLIIAKIKLENQA